MESQGTDDITVESESQVAKVDYKFVQKLVKASEQKRVLRRGLVSGAVKEAQEILGVKPDGNFSAETYAAVVDFQSKHGLEPSGKITQETWVFLLAESL